MPRVLRETTSTRCFAPECAPNEDGLAITLLPEEVELLRLIDFEGLEQEEAAVVLGVSRRTVWRDLHTARKKVAEALTTGKCLRMERCPVWSGVNARGSAAAAAGRTPDSRAPHANFRFLPRSGKDSFSGTDASGL